MSASEHINKILFHGTTYPFKKGQKVVPQGNSPYAYATDDPIYAEGIGGGSVFEVSPLNIHDVEENTDSWEDAEGTKTFQSPSGFKIVRQYK